VKEPSPLKNTKPRNSKGTSPKRAVRLQYGALPYRFDENGELEILLVTTRQSGRWIIPKGSAIKGLTRSESAAQEAYEEAGVRGLIKARSIGVFPFEKNLYEKGITVPCEVMVYPLLVTKQCKTWPEQKQRLSRWFSAAEAMAHLQDKGLTKIVRQFTVQSGSRKKTKKDQ